MSLRRVSVWFALVGLAVVLALWGVRCSQQPAGAEGNGRLVLRNLAPSSWRITLAEVGETSPRVVKLAARDEHTLELPPGTYVVSQSLLDIHGQTLEHRTLRVVIERNKTYTWALASLQTTDWEDPR